VSGRFPYILSRFDAIHGAGIRRRMRCAWIADQAKTECIPYVIFLGRFEISKRNIPCVQDM
jgi:hypothetical protein